MKSRHEEYSHERDHIIDRYDILWQDMIDGI